MMSPKPILERVAESTAEVALRTADTQGIGQLVDGALAPVFLIAAILVHTDEIALYEHGTFKPRLTNDLIERLLRNPQNFALKHFASRTGSRAKVLAALAKRLEVKPTQSDRGRAPASVLGVVSHLVAAVTAVPPHIQRTAHLSDRAGAVRKQLLEATEPDELIFKAIPKALDLKSVPARGAYHDSRKLILRLGKVFDEINAAYPALLGNLRSELSEALGVRVSSERLQQHLADRAVQLEGQVIDPNLKKLVSALKTGLEGDDQWIEKMGHCSHLGRKQAGGREDGADHGV